MIFKSLLALLIFGMTISAYGQAEWRTYTSSDGARNFDGQLLGYDEESKTATVVNRQRQTIEFDVNLLSEADQEYIVKTAPTLPVRARLDVRYQSLQERQSSDRTETTRRSESEAGYQITINNFSPLDFRDATVEYAVIYRKDSPTGPATTEIMRGTVKVDLEANGTHVIETDTVDLVSFEQRPRAVG